MIVTRFQNVVRLLSMLRHLGSRFLSWNSNLGYFPGRLPAAAKPNIILITLDSARADRMGFLGSRSGLTPALDGIAHRGNWFLRRLTPKRPPRWPPTRRFLRALIPRHIGQVNLLFPCSYITVLAGTCFIPADIAPQRLWDRLCWIPEAAPSRAMIAASMYTTLASTSRSVVKAASSQSNATGTRWLRVPQIGWPARNSGHSFFGSICRIPTLLTQLRTIEGSTAADAAVGKLVSFLRSQSLYDDALIVIASSHGESLGAHGEETHGIFLYDETIHVPLVLKLPKNQLAGKQIKNRARLLDIAPTVLAVAGIPTPAQMQGQSLMRIAQASSQNDQPSYSRSELPQRGFGCSVLESWRAGKYLYIRAPKPELYDLSTDANAAHNLAQSSKATLETMASQLQALDSHLGNEPGKSTGLGLTSSELQKLASLGYVGLQKGGAGVNAATEGTDPKEVMPAINKTLAALLELDDGKPEKAIPSLRQVLEVQPTFYLAQYGMGFALVQQGQYTDAIGYLHKAIELQPDSALAHYAMGFSLMKTGRFQGFCRPPRNRVRTIAWIRRTALHAGRGI